MEKYIRDLFEVFLKDKKGERMMPIKEFEIKAIDVVNLLLDVENPRFETQPNQRGALRTLVVEQGQKLVRLAEHIAKHGTNPSEVPIVIRSKENDNYTVLEGNRRIAAIKLATEPKLVDSLNLTNGIARKLKSLNVKYGSSLPLNLQCSVAPSREKAKTWIELRHTGENGGIGIISWNGVAASRFRGESPEIQLLETVKESDFLDNETREKLSKIAITNLQRLLGTREAIRLLGIDVLNKQLIFLNPDDRDEALGRIAIVVSDIANKHIKVTQLDTKSQRVKYANAVAERSIPTPGKKIEATDMQSGPAKTSKKGRQTTTTRIRKTLIPKSLKLNITQTRIANIYDELQRLPLDKFENSAAVLLRVFLEMSLDEFARSKKISLKKSKKNKDGTTTHREMKLKEKIACVVEHLVMSDSSCEKELYAIRTSAGTQNTIFSITSWQSYVHNQYYNPIANDLRKIWDNIQPLFEKIWA